MRAVLCSIKAKANAKETLKFVHTNGSLLLRCNFVIYVVEHPDSTILERTNFRRDFVRALILRAKKLVIGVICIVFEKRAIALR